jgi:hypothetical protein
MIQKPGKLRNQFKDQIYMPTPDFPNEALARIEAAFVAHWESEAIQKKIRAAIKDKTLPKKAAGRLLDEALSKAIITQAEYQTMKKAEELRDDAVQVDDFPVKSSNSSQRLLKTV